MALSLRRLLRHETILAMLVVVALIILAAQARYRGLAEGISQSRSVRGYPEWFYVLGQRDAAGVPVQVWIMLVAVLVSAGILGLTTFGRATYAVGANETAARFSGVAVD